MTAEEKLREGTVTYDLDVIVSNLTGEQIVSDMIEFAQFHVQAALRAAYVNGQIKMREEVYEGRVWKSNEILESSIINAYPLEKIK